MRPWICLKYRYVAYLLQLVNVPMETGDLRANCADHLNWHMYGGTKIVVYHHYMKNNVSFTYESVGQVQKLSFREKSLRFVNIWWEMGKNKNISWRMYITRMVLNTGVPMEVLGQKTVEVEGCAEIPRLAIGNLRIIHILNKPRERDRWIWGEIENYNREKCFWSASGNVWNFR